MLNEIKEQQKEIVELKRQIQHLRSNNTSPAAVVFIETKY